MARVVIEYVIRQRGTRQAARGLDQLRDRTRRAQREQRALDRTLRDTGDRLRGIGSLAARAGAVFGVAFGARELVQTADEVQRLQNRLRTVTQDTDQADAAFKALLGTAQETGGDVGALGESFVRIANATRDYGRTAGEALAVTRGLAQAAQLAGASQEEQRNAIIQLTQGLASGRLQGDELRSVLEQLPNVGRAISSELGIAFSRIRDEARAGRLTTQELFDALLAASGEFDAAFQNTEATIGQSVSRISTAVAAVTAELEKQTGAVEGFADAVEGVTDGLVEALQSGTVKESIAGTAAEIGRSFNQALADAFGDPNLGAASGFSTDDERIAALAGIPLEGADSPNSPLREAISRFFQGGADQAAESSQDLADEVGEQARAAAAQIEEQLNRTLSEGGGEGDTGPDERAIAFDSITEALERQIAAAQVGARETAILTAVRRAEQKVAKEGAELTAEETAQVRELAGALFDTNEARKEAEQTARDQADAAEQQKERTQELLDVLFPLEEINRKVREDVELLNAAYADGTLTQDEYAESLNRLGANAAKAREELGEAQGAAKAFEEVGVRAIGGLTDAVIDFAGGSKDAFRDFANQVVKDLLRVIVQLLIVRALEAAGGGLSAGGGIGATFGGVLTSVAGAAAGGRQGGGRVSPDREFRVGENGPEIFRPDTAGTIIPNGGETAASAPVMVQVVNVTDAAEIPAALQTREGEEVILNTIQQNRGQLRELLA